MMKTNRLINPIAIEIDWLEDSFEYFSSKFDKLKTEVRYSVHTDFIDEIEHPYGPRRIVGSRSKVLASLARKDRIVLSELEIREAKNMKPNILYFRISININHNIKILPEDFGKYTYLIGVVKFQMRNFDEPMTCPNQHISINYLNKGTII